MLKRIHGRILVSLATYNERENLPRLVDQIHEALPTGHILVIDDNSPDGTGQLVDTLAERDRRLHVLHREGKLGLGTAILAGMRFAQDRQYDYMVNMDADFSHHPRYLSALLAGMEEHDVMIGSRYVEGGGVRNWPWTRWLMSTATNMLVRTLMRLPARDTSGGYRCYRVELLRNTNLDGLLSRGYSFQQEVLHRCYLAGARIGETPILFDDRQQGQSKANLKEIARSLTTLLRIGIPAFLTQPTPAPTPTFAQRRRAA